MKTVVFGTTEYSEYVYYTMLAEGINNIVAFTMTSEYKNKDIFCNLPVIDFEDLDSIITDPFEILITVGYPKMNKGRERVYHLCKEKGYKVGSYISNRAICDSDNIGEGCIIMPRAFIAPCTQIGICNIISTDSSIGHTSTVGDFNWFSGNVTTAGDVTIGSRCFFGINSLICNNVKIADETLVGVCSYVAKDTKPGLAYMGMPAKNKNKMKSDIVIDFV